MSESESLGRAGVVVPAGSVVPRRASNRSLCLTSSRDVNAQSKPCLDTKHLRPRVSTFDVSEAEQSECLTVH
eukprot:755654-Pleurochrysis_carterae.AAC.1